MLFFEKMGQIRLGATRDWRPPCANMIPRREHAVRAFTDAFYNCVSRGHPAIIELTQSKTCRLTGGLWAARCKTQSPWNRHQTALNAPPISGGLHVWFRARWFQRRSFWAANRCWLWLYNPWKWQWQRWAQSESVSKTDGRGTRRLGFLRLIQLYNIIQS